jgi:nucleotide-binding universal stress UspA family protein
MAKHVLLTVSGQSSALFSLRFMDRFFANKTDFRITLFFDAPKARYQHPDQGPPGRARLQPALNEARDFLVRSGFDRDAIQTRTQLQQMSHAMDIIREGERGAYDAVALGKRSISRLEEFFERSTTREILEKEIDVPLWICRDPAEAGKDILLCLDGSEASYRMADHVGVIMDRQPGQGITLFRTTEEPRPASRKDAVLERGREILLQRGIPGDRIEARIEASDSPARSIMERAARGGYAVVAVGRTGRGMGSIKKILLGSTSNHLFRELTNCTLWVCR